MARPTTKGSIWGAESLKRSLEPSCNNNQLAQENPVTDIWFGGLESLKRLEAYRDLGVVSVLRLNVLDIKHEFGQIAVFPSRPYIP